MKPKYLIETAQTLQWLRGHLAKVGVRSVDIDCVPGRQSLMLYGDTDSESFTITECATWLKEGRNELLHQMRQRWRRKCPPEFV